MPVQSRLKITALMEDDQQRLHDQRSVIERYLGNDESRRKYQTTDGKLGAIREILQSGIFRSEQTYELQCLGVILSDALVLELEMEWVIVEDAYGRTPAIRMPGTTIILYPLTMISTRIERGEQVDVFALFNGIAGQVGALTRPKR